jgi:DNA-3-methyladenine glycosylase I
MAVHYCDFAPDDPWHGPYHDTEYGFPIRDDAVLFERLALEVNQAGLSWLTVLKKRPAFSQAFAGFVPARVAAFDDGDRQRLLADAGIIRNRLKVDAVIHNAGVVLGLIRDHASFSGWLDSHHPLEHADWVRLFKQTFRFTGDEITREFLLSTGYLQGAHRSDCPVACRIAALSPPWMAT